ncbi:NRDE family protein [Guptibacillus hwajinpoensis]|uniref:NRDE family protein n=1 Tax=Guptibacillus hwajinpoensis TaxID=208199 RepID=UPI001CFC49C9|nr:NRDE family protein [Pseudalkalibacillus hwajinpoensis]WLR59912.1 NRDE family protein [Pseudalkalibacillus hwajinpoensis]
MCLIAVAQNVHPTYPFILVANRDEFYERPTKPANYWEDVPELLAGRDLKAMGTWLGVTTNGRIAALTNYREANEQPKSLSRGDLTADYLRDHQSPLSYLEMVRQKKDQYNGFNLIIGDFKSLYYYSNRQEQITKLENGVHAVSNHLLNTSWPKVEQLKEELKHYLSAEKNLDQNRLFEMLSHAEPAPDHLLPQTGVPIEWERMLSPVYIKSDHYGTRAQTVIMVSQNGEVTFIERSGEDQENYYQFNLDEAYLRSK